MMLLMQCFLDTEFSHVRSLIFSLLPKLFVTIMLRIPACKFLIKNFFSLLKFNKFKRLFNHYLFCDGQTVL